MYSKCPVCGEEVELDHVVESIISVDTNVHAVSDQLPSYSSPSVSVDIDAHYFLFSCPDCEAMWAACAESTVSTLRAGSASCGC